LIRHRKDKTFLKKQTLLDKKRKTSPKKERRSQRITCSLQAVVSLWHFFIAMKTFNHCSEKI
jgi:hypothetical protein